MLPCVCLTNTCRFHVAIRRFSNRSQMTSKCGKNKKSGTRGDSRVYHWRSYHILTSSVIVTKQMRRNKESFWFVIYITQVILASWLDRRGWGRLAFWLSRRGRGQCMIDVILTKFFPLRFKMAERFENLDNILCAWVKEKIMEADNDNSKIFAKSEKMF